MRSRLHVAAGSTAPRWDARHVTMRSMRTTTINPEPSFEEAEAIDRFWAEHHDELLAGYPEQFVAVKDGEVVASNTDLALLIYDLRDQGLSPRTDVWIEFITANVGKLLL